MSWQEPKTNWKAGDTPNSGDFNRIEENTKELGDKTFPHIDDETIHVTPNSSITGATLPSQIPRGLYLTHAPSSSTFAGTGRSGNVITSSTNGYVIQVFVGSDNKIMTRRGNGESWGEWEKGGNVDSVNGKIGTVKLTMKDIGVEFNTNFQNINVSTQGSDYSGDGSSSKPYRTIQKSIDEASKSLNTNITIHVDGTNYSTETLNFPRMSKPFLQIYASDGCTVKSIDCKYFQGNLLLDSIGVSSSCDIQNVVGFKANRCVFNGPIGIRLTSVPNAEIRGCTFNCMLEAVFCYNSFVVCENNKGNVETYAFRTSSGIIFADSSNEISGSKGKYFVDEAGQIFTTSKIHTS